MENVHGLPPARSDASRCRSSASARTRYLRSSSTGSATRARRAASAHLTQHATVTLRVRETSRVAKRPLYSPKEQLRTPRVPGVASAQFPIFASDAERGGRCGNLEKLTTPHWHRTSASACTLAKTCMENTKNGGAMSSSVAARAEARLRGWVCTGSGARRNRQKGGSQTMSWRVSKMVQCTPSLYVAMGYGRDGRTRRVRAVLTMPQLEQLADPA